MEELENNHNAEAQPQPAPAAPEPTAEAGGAAEAPADGVTLSVRDFVGGFTEALAMWSGVIGVFNLIPFRTRRYPSDGAQLLEIVQRSRRIGRR